MSYEMEKRCFRKFGLTFSPVKNIVFSLGLGASPKHELITRSAFSGLSETVDLSAIALSIRYLMKCPSGTKPFQKLMYETFIGITTKVWRVAFGKHVIN